MNDREQDYTWFFRAEFPGVVRTAFLVVHDRQQAEDIAQDAFTQLLVHWPKISRYDRPESWVRRVAIRAAVRHVRRERMRETLERRVAHEPAIDVPLDVDLLRAIALFRRSNAPLSRSSTSKTDRRGKWGTSSDARSPQRRSTCSRPGSAWRTC